MSYMMTVSAACRLRPTPPALTLSRKTDTADPTALPPTNCSFDHSTDKGGGVDCHACKRWKINTAITIERDTGL